jgi:hypothetical protein
MSIQAPQGILNIPNATLRVGRLEISEVVGADTALNTIARNTILLVDDEAYHENKNWALKLPNAWAGEFECNTASAGNYSEFNFYNEGASSNVQGYNLTFNDTAVELRYDGTLLKTGTLASTITGTGVKKVRLMFERTILSVTVDGTLVFTHDDTVGPRPRVYSTTAGGFLNFFTDGGALKNLKIVNEKWMSDGTSNIAYVGGGEVAVGQALAFNRVSNVSQIKVDSNVVTEYTGPHDRPLRKYPEVALTSASQDGYVVTQSGGTAYLALDEDTSTRWYSGSDSHYDSAGGAAITDPNNANVAPRLDTNTDYGDWLAIEVPTGIKLESFKLMRFDGGFPSSGTLYAKNSSGDSWTEIYRYDGYTGPSTGDQQDWTHVFHVNSTIVYKNFALVGRVREAGQQGSPGLSLKDWELYGYEEGSGSLDTTLKSVYNVPATTGTQLEVYYDAKDLADGAVSSDVTDLSPNSNDGSPTDVSVSDGAFVFNGTSSLMEKTSLSIPGGDNPFTISFWLKNDDFDSNQYILRLGINQTIYQTVAIYKNSSNQIIFASWTLDFPIDYTFTTNQWNHISLVYPGGGWKQSNLIAYIDGRPYTFGGNVSSGGVGGTVLSLATSLTLRLGGYSSGNTIFDGSIANFRLYSKALNADQVKELYDYQKDYFLGSKSQVTLYKGHLGVGVTEPSGQLELAGDERIQEYPPRALTGYETLVEGHGVFYASASSLWSTNGSYDADHVFDNKSGTYWVSQGNGSELSYDADGIATSDDQFNPGGGVSPVNGSWIKLKLPYGIKLGHCELTPRPSTQTAPPPRQPRSGIIWGSNDDVNWDQVSTFLFSTIADLYTFTINSSKSYKYITLQVTATQTITVTASTDYNAVAIIGLRFFGTPGPTTLDKGSLTLGRSLDVPRISRYDVDTETPRPEKLVLDFDTTVNSSPTDISGKGNHGVYFGSASYSAADKAFSTPNSSGITVTGSSLGSGAQPLTLCAWAKGNIWDTTDNDCVIGVGPNSSSGHSSFQLCVNTTHITLDMATSTNYLEFPTTLTNGRWYFIAMTYTGGDAFTNTRVYVDGVEIAKPASWTNGISALLDLPANPDIGVGTRTGNGSGNTPAGFLNGYVSNPKVYNVALEPSEVKKLYNLGRTGRSMVISDTAVGIGKVPEAQLDVRGTANFAGSVGIGTTSPYAKLEISSTTQDSNVAFQNVNQLRINCTNTNSSTGTGGGITFCQRYFSGSDSMIATGGVFGTRLGSINGNYGGGLVFKYKPNGSGPIVEGMVLSSGGNVGIGTTNPKNKLHIVHPTDGGGTKDLDGQENCAITSQREGYNNRWMHGINGTFDYLFWYDADGSGIATCKAFFDQDGTNSVDLNFTGQHRTFIKDVPFSQAGNLEGLIVSADQNKYIKMTGGIEAGSNAITTNESLPVVSLSTTTNDKKCFGVISVSEDSETRQNRFGNIVSVSQKELGDTRVYINSVGEGAIWVTDINGTLESGDYITTSNVAGYGQKQDSDSLKNYTVAKITMDCDFDPVTQPVQIIRKEMGDVNYWVKTTYETVTEEEYSNLADENRQIVDGVYQKITKEESKTDREGYELEVRQELVNVLDEHGQIQWEDDPSGATEKAYKIRYLDANGNITDEANHVYKAAFVGCTYHCG